MRAIIAKELGPPENLVIEDVEELTAGPGQIVVDNKAAAVNFPDLLVMEGKYQFCPPLPFSPGKEGAGIVKLVGDGVTRFKVGDRVMVQVEYGSYAQEVVAEESHCYPIPHGVSFEEAAAVGIAYQTAYFGLVDQFESITPGKLQEIDKKYKEINEWTSCDVFYLNVDDEDLEREMKEIMGFLDGRGLL